MIPSTVIEIIIILMVIIKFIMKNVNAYCFTQCNIHILRAFSHDGCVTFSLTAYSKYNMYSEPLKTGLPEFSENRTYFLSSINQ